MSAFLVIAVISPLVAIVGAFAGSILLGALGNEAHAWSGRLARSIIRRAAKFQPASERDDYLDENLDIINCFLKVARESSGTLERPTSFASVPHSSRTRSGDQRPVRRNAKRNERQSTRTTHQRAPKSLRLFTPITCNQLSARSFSSSVAEGGQRQNGSIRLSLGSAQSSCPSNSHATSPLGIRGTGRSSCSASLS